MTGPEHYREAERLLSWLPSHGLNPETGFDRAETLYAAQVHATLALVAATIESMPHSGAESPLTPRLIKAHPTDARQHEYRPSEWAEAIL